MLNLLLVSRYELSFTSSYFWVVLMTFVVVVVLTYLYYRRTNPMLDKSKRIILGILRGIGLAAIFLALAEPLLVINRAETKQPVVALMVDKLRLDD